jgi:hypothetical protein
MKASAMFGAGWENDSLHRSWPKRIVVEGGWSIRGHHRGGE